MPHPLCGTAVWPDSYSPPSQMCLRMSPLAHAHPKRLVCSRMHYRGQVLYDFTMKTAVFINTCTMVQSMPYPFCGAVALLIVLFVYHHTGLRMCQVAQAYPNTTFCDGLTCGARYLCRSDFSHRFPVVMVTCIRGLGGRLSNGTSGADGCCCRCHMS